MPLMRQRSLLTAKIEATYDTDSLPAVSTDAVIVENLSLSFPSETIDRNFVRGSLSPNSPIRGRRYVQISFETELKGSGTAGTPADWGPLLRACAFDQTIVATTSVAYEPISTAFESVTIYVYRDGLLYKFTGCRGEVSFRMAVGQRPMMAFSMQGHCVDVVDAVLPTPTVDTTKPVAMINSAYSLNGYAGVIANLSISMGNNIIAADSINHATGYSSFEITGRTVQGSLDPEATRVATHNYWSEWKNGTEMALSIAANGGAGNIATLTAPKVVFRELAEGDRSGILTYELGFTCAADAGDDELRLVMT